MSIFVVVKRKELILCANISMLLSGLHLHLRVAKCTFDEVILLSAVQRLILITILGFVCVLVCNQVL